MAVDQAAIAASVQAALAKVKAAIAGVGTISTATPFALAPVAAAVSAEIATLEDAIAAYDGDIITSNVAGMVAGTPAPMLQATLIEQVSDSQQIGTLLAALGYLRRIATNLAQATG